MAPSNAGLMQTTKPFRQFSINLVNSLNTYMSFNSPLEQSNLQDGSLLTMHLFDKVLLAANTEDGAESNHETEQIKV